MAENLLKNLPTELSGRKTTFYVQSLLAKGGFSQIYKVVCLPEYKLAALKVAEIGNKYLENEAFIYKNVLRNHDCPFLPIWYDRGTNQALNINFFLMPIYAQSLNEYIGEKCNKKLNTKEVTSITSNILEALKFLFSKKVVHGDIKSLNLMLPIRSKLDNIKLIDFGASMVLKNFNENDDLEFQNVSKVGTCLYASIKWHETGCGSFKGDTESLAYNLIEWINGSLPWKDLSTKPEENIYIMKLSLKENIVQTISKMDITDTDKELLSNVLQTIFIINIPIQKLHDRLIKIMKNQQNIFLLDSTQLSISPKMQPSYKTENATRLNIISRQCVVKKKLPLLCTIVDKNNCSIHYMPYNDNNAYATLLNFEIGNVRGFVYLLRSKEKTFEAVRRLNSNVSSLESLLRGLVSALKSAINSKLSRIIIYTIDNNFHKMMENIEEVTSNNFKVFSNSLEDINVIKTISENISLFEEVMVANIDKNRNFQFLDEAKELLKRECCKFIMP
uniref:non-specific serine/threonine protein kinase n=1 Tax=Strongyloides venezuelensis TaxID=75913 RepID=A0A0K0FRN7_STRVS